jgi:hypothetical protein
VVWCGVVWFGASCLIVCLDLSPVLFLVLPCPLT